MCSFNPDAFLEISSRIMDLDTNRELCKINIILNSRINPIYMEKAHFFGHSPWLVLEFRFVNNKVQQADAEVSSVTLKEKTITIKLLPESNIVSLSINSGGQRTSVKKHQKVSLALCVGSSNMYLTL